ncbi:LytR/AlgR family response regulator transcription factor [Alkalicoccus urumqiensis]|uniref:DNA-binding response regulator n=1 Tax=Alkalicoccus urumqiensis TaxID=1548213 RepID=A0A2P6MLE6_ALKUR|nr:LytTR family DNA-binding domain-containing protein [Alkalicoccus urumqiensis]PRO67099.1 DNA-binding response regulator [Alkalicoccus urumqiensis]
MKPIRALLVDDERFSREELRHLLSMHSHVDIAAEAKSAYEALELILVHKPDVVFLDIDMGGRTGIDVASSIRQMDHPPLIVFATAYPDYAVDAFRVEALDYVLKPFEEESINRVVRRLDREMEAEAAVPAPRRKIPLQLEDSIQYLRPEDIAVIYREGSQTNVVTTNEVFSTRQTLKEMEEKLSGHSFFRVHKGYLVNLHHVAELVPWFNGAYQLKVNGMHEVVPVSRNYVKELRLTLEA